jgi:hypothetical protein
MSTERGCGKAQPQHLAARIAMETKLALRLGFATAALHQRLIRKDGDTVRMRPNESFKRNLE